MSLINDALKKAQRERAGQSGPLPSSSGGVGRRGMSTQTMVLIGIGGLVLVSLSVVFTVFLTSSPTPTTAAPLALSQQKMGVAPAAANAAPTIVFSTADKAPPATAATNPSPPLVAVQVVAAPPTSPPISPRSSGTAFSKTTDQIQDMVDKFRVAGVRSSATGSKVLMNDHIVKLNEVIDRETGLKLIKIEDSALTFQDSTGVQYTKSF